MVYIGDRYCKMMIKREGFQVSPQKIIFFFIHASIRKPKEYSSVSKFLIFFFILSVSHLSSECPILVDI